MSPTKSTRLNGRATPKRTADPDAAARQRDLRLGFLIHDVSRMRRSAFDKLMRPLGITRAQWWVIAHLSRHDGMMQIQLADILDVGKASLGTVVDRLETAGLVERRADPIDRRAKRVFMTRKAHQLLDKMQGAERAYNAHILKNLSDAERDELVRMLSLIRANLVDFNPETADGTRRRHPVDMRRPSPLRRPTS